MHCNADDPLRPCCAGASIRLLSMLGLASGVSGVVYNLLEMAELAQNGSSVNSPGLVHGVGAFAADYWVGLHCRQCVADGRQRCGIIQRKRLSAEPLQHLGLRLGCLQSALQSCYTQCLQGAVCRKVMEWQPWGTTSMNESSCRWLVQNQRRTTCSEAWDHLAPSAWRCNSKLAAHLLPEAIRPLGKVLPVEVPRECCRKLLCNCFGIAPQH